MNVKPKKLAVLGATVAAVLLIFSMTGYSTSSAQQTQFVAERAIGTEGIIKIKSLDILEKVGQNKDIEIMAEKGAGKLAFKAINKANKDIDFKVDLWKISVDGTIVDINPLPISAMDNEKLKAQESRLVADFSIEDYFEELEEYPGIYKVTLLGFDREYALKKVQEYSEKV